MYTYTYKNTSTQTIANSIRDLLITDVLIPNDVVNILFTSFTRPDTYCGKGVVGYCQVQSDVYVGDSKVDRY